MSTKFSPSPAQRQALSFLSKGWLLGWSGSCWLEKDGLTLLVSLATARALIKRNWVVPHRGPKLTESRFYHLSEAGRKQLP